MNDLDDDLELICASDMTLSQRLGACAERLRLRGSPVAARYDALVKRLKSGAVGSGSPNVGDPMPAFLLPGRAGRLIDLRDIVLGRPVVISFNRGHWCGFCNVELRTLAQAQDRLAKLGARILSIMPDRQAFVHRLPPSVTDSLEVLSDIDNAYALSLGLGMWIDEDLRERMLAHDLRLDVYHGNGEWVLPLPATFVVGREGRVIARHVDADFRNRMDMADIVDAVSREGAA